MARGSGRAELSDGALWKERFGGAVENYLDNCVHTKVNSEDLERLEPENEGVSLKVHPEGLDERRQQYFPTYWHSREKGPLRGKQKNDGCRVRVRRQQSKNVGNKSGHGIWVPRRNGESSSVPREDPENADAAAKLAFIQGRGKASGSRWKTSESGGSLSKRLLRIY